MHLSTKLLLLSVVLTMIGYYGFLWIRYLRGKFQYTPLIPGKYIFPKRIKDEIRLSILMLFKSYKIHNLHRLEEELTEHLLKNKINTVDNSMTSKEFYNYKISFGEDSFKYFLYLYKSGIITGIIKPSQLVSSNVILSKQYLRTLNRLVFTKYSKRYMLGDNERSVVLAEIIRQVLDILNSSHKPLPYNYNFYNVISRDEVIIKYRDIIEQAIGDREVVSLINSFHLNYNPIYFSNGQMQTLMFICRVCLLTKWLKK